MACYSLVLIHDVKINIKEANAGGNVGFKLGRCGFQAIIAEGKSDEWMVLKVTAGGASLEPAGDIVGLKNYDACDKLRGRYGDKVGIAIIGRAGEMKMINSSVAITDPEAGLVATVLAAEWEPSWEPKA
ncbi:hypothetical protein LCGC14_1857220 [marine sediment metagenome]|uniref:Aldehyde ferredoxin oxidoreductase N-terminal domain-containing protein n=1 Tax=marine sediment metagenome TaxID=412755 RepID=A0A0F9IN09_9ZZZZ